MAKLVIVFSALDRDADFSAFELETEMLGAWSPCNNVYFVDTDIPIQALFKKLSEMIGKREHIMIFSAAQPAATSPVGNWKMWIEGLPRLGTPF